MFQGRKFKMNTAGRNNFKANFKTRYGSPTHNHYNSHDNSHRPRNNQSHFNHRNNQQQLDSYFTGPFQDPSSMAGGGAVPALSSALYPPSCNNHINSAISATSSDLHSSPSSSAPAAVNDEETSSSGIVAGSNSSPLSSSLSTGTSPGPNNATTINVANSSSGNSSGPVSGGSSAGANTPIQSTLKVDNWNQETVATISSHGSNRNSQERGGGQDNGAGGHGHGHGKEFTAFIGSLDYSITSEVLESTFKSRYPSVSRGKVILEEATGQSKGFGFVHFSSQVEYKAALAECANQPVFGGPRGIRISEAHPKPPRNHFGSGSVTSGDGFNRGPRFPSGGYVRPNVGIGPDIGVSNGLIHAGGGAGKHGGGKGGVNRYSSSQQSGDNSNFDQQKRQAQMDAIAQVRNWYPGGANNGGQNAQGNSNNSSSGGGHGRPGQSPRQQHQQHYPNQFQQMMQGMAGMELSGAPIILPPADGSQFPYWTPTATTSPYGQAIPTGYPTPLDAAQFAGGAPAAAYWTAGTGPNGQPIYFAADPSQIYGAATLADYSAMTSGQVPTPYPRIPYNEQTAHMFAPSAMMQPGSAAAQVPMPNNGMHHYMAGAGGAGDLAPGHVMPGGGVGGPTPPSDNENLGMIPVSANGWVQN